MLGVDGRPCGKYLVVMPDLPLLGDAGDLDRRPCCSRSYPAQAGRRRAAKQLEGNTANQCATSHPLVAFAYFFTELSSSEATSSTSTWAAAEASPPSWARTVTPSLSITEQKGQATAIFVAPVPSEGRQYEHKGLSRWIAGQEPLAPYGQRVVADRWAGSRVMFGGGATAT
jgi:hypothetical protein